MNYSDPDTVPATWTVGDVILDRYEVTEVFTGGGMGLVYRVRHRDWSIDLAVKAPRPEFLQSPQQIENFEREAETWVSVGLHPHIVSCYYVRRLGGIPRIFAEFAEGGTLNDWIRAKTLYQGGKERALERVIDVAIQFAWGLQHAHEKGLIHQDVKPGNVLLLLDGTAKVSDFGLANARGALAEQITTARHGGQSILVPGSGFMTPEYASPEQLRGGTLSRKTDIWSWAVSLLEMLLGELTWTSGLVAPAVIDEIDDAHLDKELIVLLEGCFGSHSRERFTSFEPIISALLAYYTSRFGEYPRAKPELSQLSSDETNNRAVSLADLGKDEDALTALEDALSADPTHTLTIYNYALINRRRGYKNDEFGRDALYALLQRDPDDALAHVANALFCMERGVAVRASDLLIRLKGLADEMPPPIRELERMLLNTPKRELERPEVFKVSDAEILSLHVSPNGAYIIIQGSEGLTSYLAATGDRCVNIGSEYRFLRLSGDKAILRKGGRVFVWNFRDEPAILDPFRIEIPSGECFVVNDSGDRCCVVDYTTLRMLDTATGEVLWEDELDDGGSEPSIKDIAFSADERFISFARSNFLEDLQVRDAEDGGTVRMGKCAVDGCENLIPFGNRFMLSVNWNRLLQLWDLEERTALGSAQLHREARLGVPSANTELLASLEPSGAVKIFKTPRLSSIASIAWWELFSDAGKHRGRPTCVSSSDGRTWYVGTSEGEIIRFRLSEPQYAPLLIGKPASGEKLALRWQSQAKLLDDARCFFEKGEFSKALEMSHDAALIRGGRSHEAIQLNDRVAAVGRKQSVAGVRLVFDLERTILGGQFQLLDVSDDGRCALAERTHFRHDKDYAGDYYRIIHLRTGGMERFSKIIPERRLLRRLSVAKDSIIVGRKAGLSVVSIVNEQSRDLTPPPIWGPTVYQGSRVHEPSYYASDVQTALGGRIIIATDLAAEWCPDKGRCEEWHLFNHRTGDVETIHTNTSHLRVMPDGFHAYAIAPQGIHWLWWPFRNAFETFVYPKALDRSRIEREAIAFTSNGSQILLGDEEGLIHVYDRNSYNGWRTFEAHEGKIARIFAGGDPRFIATSAADGLKIWSLGGAPSGWYSHGIEQISWKPGCQSLLWSQPGMNPEWISEDFRFAIDKKGSVSEIEWHYSFQVLPDLKTAARPYIEGFLKARKASIVLTGKSSGWEAADANSLVLYLARFGCGMMPRELANDIVTTDFEQLL
jgi:serine/threonine protein kinase/WD40 repeat protein